MDVNSVSNSTDGCRGVSVWGRAAKFWVRQGQLARKILVPWLSISLDALTWMLCGRACDSVEEQVLEVDSIYLKPFCVNRKPKFIPSITYYEWNEMCPKYCLHVCIMCVLYYQHFCKALMRGGSRWKWGTTLFPWWSTAWWKKVAYNSVCKILPQRNCRCSKQEESVYIFEL